MTNPVRKLLIAGVAATALASAAAQASPLNLVWFAGGGGSSEGMREAGFAPHYALNHNKTALWMHQVNHPECVHLREDAQAIHPLTLEPGRRIRIFWASPDCTHFSVARGGAPKSPRIRGLAWCVIPWAKLRRPDVIFLENVKEFMTWGPLYPDDHPRAGKPIPERSGETFRRWTRRLEQCGYQVEFKVLCAADYGAPTTRKRLFMIARSDGEEIVWPERTHAPRKDAARLGLKPYESAASIIDWSERCPSIFMSAMEAKAEGLNIKRPLVDATERRIAKGIERYIVGSAEPFIFGCGGRRGQSPAIPVGEAYPTITGKADAWLCAPSVVPITHSGERRVPGADEPLPTITSAHRGEFGLSAATLTKFHGESAGAEIQDPAPTITANNFIKRPGGAVPIGVVEAELRAGMVVGSAYGDDRPGAGLRAWDGRDPLRTITSGGNGGFAAAEVELRSGFLTPRYGEAPGQQPRALSANDPYPTAVPTGNGGQLVSASLIRQFGTATANDIEEPVGTIMSEGGGGKTGLMAATLTTYYGTGVGSDVGDPVRTVTGEDRHGVAAAFLEQANTGNIGHSAHDPVSTILGAGHSQRPIEARLTRMGAAEGTRRRQVLMFLWKHFGEPTAEDWANPTGTLQARLRFGLVLFGGAVWEIADIGMRMLKPRELFSAQGFRPDYVIDRDPWGGRITGTAATLMCGNAVPPPFARALCEANLGQRPEPQRAAA